MGESAGKSASQSSQFGRNSSIGFSQSRQTTIDTDDARETIREDQFRMFANRCRRIATTIERVTHGERQRRFTDEIDGIADIGSNACRRFATLLATDTGDHYTSDSQASQEEVKTAVSESIMRVFVKSCVGIPCTAVKRTQQTRFNAERAFRFDVENIQHWYAALTAARNQAL